MCKFRDLTADEIECRVKKVLEGGAILLLYKTARADYGILDETVTPDRWQCDYREVKGNMYCSIKIWSESLGQWISKENCGIESREDDDGNEKKGEASDAFKRAGFTWGIGRKLYTAPFIFIPARSMNITNGKTYDTFSLTRIEYDDNKIIGLTIMNDKTKQVAFVWDEKTPVRPAAAAAKYEPAEKPGADICSVCGKKVPPAYSDKKQRELSGAEIIAAYGGICRECHARAAKNVR